MPEQVGQHADKLVTQMTTGDAAEETAYRESVMICEAGNRVAQTGGMCR